MAGMLAYVKRTTVMLTDEVDARVRQEAVRRGITVSEWTREAVEAHLPPTGGHRLSGAGMFHSGRDDISERIDELLAEGLGL
jgi:hypothetical protein